MRYAWSSMSSVMAAPCNQSVFGPRNMLLMVIYVLQGQFSPKAICGFFVIDSWLHLFWGNTWTPHILLCQWFTANWSLIWPSQGLCLLKKEGSKCWFLIYCMFKCDDNHFVICWFTQSELSICVWFLIAFMFNIYQCDAMNMCDFIKMQFSRLEELRDSCGDKTRHKQINFLRKTSFRKTSL